MESLCYSANKGSDDAYDVYTSLTVTKATVSELEHPSSASQDEDSEGDGLLSTAPTQCTAAPSAAFTVNRSGSTQTSEEHTPLQRSLAAGKENRRLVPHARLPLAALSLGRVCGKCPDAARLHHQRAETTWKQGMDRIRRVPTVRLLPGPTTGTRRNLQRRRSNARTLRMRSRRGVSSSKRRGAGVICSQTAPTTGMKSQICVTRAFTTRPLVWTADGRPHPAVTRSLQCAADVASSRTSSPVSSHDTGSSTKSLGKGRVASLVSLIEPFITGATSPPLLTVENWRPRPR